MKRLIGIIGAKLQATFPPNRVMLLVAGPITAGSTWISAYLASHVPGLALPVGVVAGVMGSAALITVTLIYKWFEQWRQNEPVTVDADLEHALLQELERPDHFEEFLHAHGTVEGIGLALKDLVARIEQGKVNEADVARELDTLTKASDNFLEAHPPFGEEPATTTPAAGVDPVKVAVQTATSGPEPAAAAQQPAAPQHGG